MSRAKRTSNSLDNLKARLSGMSAIDPKLDLGNGITVEAAEELLRSCETKLQEYNTFLSVVDEKQYDVEKLEKEIDAFCVKILASAAVKYGKDSIEYEKVGGTRVSDIKRGKRKSDDDDKKGI